MLYSELVTGICLCDQGIGKPWLGSLSPGRNSWSISQSWWQALFTATWKYRSCTWSRSISKMCFQEEYDPSKHRWNHTSRNWIVSFQLGEPNECQQHYKPGRDQQPRRQSRQTVISKVKRLSRVSFGPSVRELFSEGRFGKTGCQN